MDVEPRFLVRVLVLDHVTQCTLQSSSALRLGTAGADANIKSGQGRLRAAVEPVKITVSGGSIQIAGEALQPGDILVSPEDPYVFTLNGNAYRGSLRLVPNPDGKTFDAVNVVPLEPYLAGVVGAEMPDYWEPEALKAQAIVARTYCLYVKKRFGENRSWDVSRTQASQVYRGLAVESSQIWSAVRSTSGKVLVLSANAAEGQGHPSPSPGPIAEGGPTGGQLFPTYYHSICGGHTENSENVFSDSHSPLTGVDCPYCRAVAKVNLFYWPDAQFDRAAVCERLLQKYPKLASLGRITRIVAAQKSDYGEFSRLTKVSLIGANGRSEVLRAEDLRLTIDPTGRLIKSAACTIMERGDKWAFVAGRGWGHGVGLCQCGAEGMARKGKTASEILEHYYPGSQIVSVY